MMELKSQCLCYVFLRSLDGNDLAEIDTVNVGGAAIYTGSSRSKHLFKDDIIPVHLFTFNGQLGFGKTGDVT